MPDQLQHFDDFGLSEHTRQALAEMGFVAPTEVQSATFASIVEGKDLMVQARTGTGKTAAFAIPAADRLLSLEPRVQLLGLCPTRELAIQVAGELETIGRPRGLKIATVYGGAPMSKQVRQLEDGAQAVIGTPGRILDHIRRGTLKLDGVRFLVLDEADEMLSMGFEKDISAIIEQIPDRRQTLLFSATIPPEIQKLAGRYMKEPQVLSLSDDYVGAKEIEHSFYMVSGTGRLADLVRIIDVEDPEAAIVFCNTREDVQVVASGLKRHGFAVDWISSDLSQPEREVAMARMRDSNVRFLVATDVAARGIDISHVTHVINYTFPESLEVYIHRTGRTGRMGRTGFAISLITPRDVGNLYFLKLQYKITPIERELPTLGEIAARRESDLLATLLSTRLKPLGEAHLSLARRVMSHARGTELVGALLESVLGPLDATEAEKNRRGREGPLEITIAPEEKAPAAPAAPSPAPAASTPRRSRSATARSVERPSRREQPEPAQELELAAPGTEPGAPAEAEPPAESTVEAPAEPTIESPVEPTVEESLGRPTLLDPTNEPGSAEPEEAADGSEGDDSEMFKEIYLSVGRRDGVRAGEIVRLLGEKGVDRSLVDRIRVRDRSTFVGVRADIAATAVAALDGARFGDRVAMAEPAKRVRS